MSFISKFIFERKSFCHFKGFICHFVIEPKLYTSRNLATSAQLIGNASILLVPWKLFRMNHAHDIDVVTVGMSEKFVFGITHLRDTHGQSLPSEPVVQF